MSQLLIALISWEVQLVKAEGQKRENIKLSLDFVPSRIVVELFMHCKIAVFTRYEQMAGGQWSDRHGGSETSGCRSCPPEQQNPAGEPWMCQ